VSPISNVKRLVTGGCDHLVKIWWYDGACLICSQNDAGNWIEEAVLEGHTDWVRDVAWAPNIGITASYIASGSQVFSFCKYLG
jgi:protein transport protein SEC13